MVEGKRIFLSILAALLSGIILIPLTILLIGNLDQFVRDLVIAQLESAGAPPNVINATIARIEGIINFVIPLTPISSVMQLVLFGAIMGLLYGYLIEKRGVRPVYSALLTGSTYLVLLNLLPIAVIYVAQAEVAEVLFKYIHPLIVIVPGVAYTAILTILSAVKGPWSKWAEAKPERY